MSSCSLAIRVLRLILFSICLVSGFMPLYSEFQILWEPNLYSIQDNSQWTRERNQYRNRESNYSFRLGISAELESSLAYWEGGLNILWLANSKDSNKVSILPNQNAFVAFLFPFGDLWIGRKSFIQGQADYKQEQLGIYRNQDGGDGVGIELDWIPKTVIQFYLYDFYFGFPIWHYNQTPVYGMEFWDYKSQRYRQGVRIFHSRQNWEFSGDVFYFFFGNWGRTAREDFQLNTLEGGDGDFLFRYRGKISYLSEKQRFGQINLGLEYHLVRGLDKTFSDPKRPERSLPIRGEAVALDGNWKGDRPFFHFYLFLPNVQQTNESIEPITIGYIGMGNPYTFSHFISRERGYMPSAWITAAGKEWNRWDREFLIGNKAPASLVGWELGWIQNQWIWVGFGDWILPRRIPSNSKGQMSLRKQDYESYFLKEMGIRITYQILSFDSQYQLGWEISHLWSQRDVPIGGTFIHLWGTVVF